MMIVSATPFNFYSGKINGLGFIPTMTELYREAELLSDIEDAERTRTVEAALRADGVLPHRRLALNGILHQRLAAMFVLLASMPSGATLESRDVKVVSLAHLPSNFLGYLDDAQAQGFITSDDTARARGKLQATDKLKSLSRPLTPIEYLQL